ncbi:MAG: hypothetical protein HC927_10625 [Deltaproteobacteria bacterium]|nr:hypothetical protein [Deltaproteobacteria bacterium]
MSRLQDLIEDWADRYIGEILAAPRMYGSLEAVEMQIVQLLEIRALATRPEQELENPRRVLDTYLAFLRDRYPHQPSLPLFKLVESSEAGEGAFVEALKDFHRLIKRTILPENPFAHSDLALQLTFDVGRQATTSAFTGYYEEFRRAMRAVTRKDRSVGRAAKEIELTTDFTLEDAVVSQPNGAPGKVLLRLGRNDGQQDWEAEQRVREGISKLLTVVEWAGSGASLADLGVDDAEQRTRFALQARRLLPRRGIKTVAVGGLLVARSKPIEIHAAHESRFLEVVGSQSPAHPFDETDEIRAIDLDRGLVVLGKQRTQCFVHPEHLGEVAEVGVQARVRGQQYRPLMGRAFVLADTIEIEPGPSGD